MQWRDPVDVQNEHQHGALIVQTKQSHLIYHSLLYTPQPYLVPAKGNNGPNIEFPPGSGEGTPTPGLWLRSDSYLDLQKEGISAWCATDDFCLVACKEPLQLACIPWSTFQNNLERVKTAPDAPKRATFHGVSVTRLSDLDWLIDKTCRFFCAQFCLLDQIVNPILSQRPSSRSHILLNFNFSSSLPPTVEHTACGMCQKLAMQLKKAPAPLLLRPLPANDPRGFICAGAAVVCTEHPQDQCWSIDLHPTARLPSSPEGNPVCRLKMLPADLLHPLLLPRSTLL